MTKVLTAILALAIMAVSTPLEAQRAQPVAVRSLRLETDGSAAAARVPAPYRAFWGAAIGAGLGALLGHAACDSCDSPGPVYLMAGVGAAAGLVVALVWPASPDDGLRGAATAR